MGSGKYLKSSITKHGIKNFVKEILFIFDNEEEMKKKKKDLVTEEFCLRKDTYNICVGGKGGFSYINKTPGLRNGFEKRVEGNKELSIRAQKRLKILREDVLWKQKVKTLISRGVKKYFSFYSGNFVGKTHTKETKELIGAKSSISQAGHKNSQFGTMWITDGIKNKKIKKFEEIPSGWYKGRC